MLLSRVRFVMIVAFLVIATLNLLEISGVSGGLGSLYETIMSSI